MGRELSTRSSLLRAQSSPVKEWGVHNLSEDCIWIWQYIDTQSLIILFRIIIKPLKPDFVKVMLLHGPNYAFK